MKKLLTATLATALTLPVHAIEYGRDALESEYNDFFVQIAQAEASGYIYQLCGGSLIGARYLLTAKHCLSLAIADITEDNTGFTDTIRIHRGMAYESPTFIEVGYTIIADGQNSSQSTDAQQRYSDYEAALWAAYPSMSYVNNISHFGDVVLLKLDHDVYHNQSALISPVFDISDINSTENMLPTNTPITFFGWGRDEDGNDQTTLQAGEFLAFSHRGLPAALGQNNEGDWVKNGCEPPFDYHPDFGTPCEWVGNDLLHLYGIGDQHATSGDSGSPLVYNNHILAVAKSELGGETTFTHFAGIMDYIQMSIDSVVYPPRIELDVSSGATTTQSFEIAVQNFTNADVTLTPQLANSMYFDVDTTDCETTLSSVQGCLIGLTINPSQSALTQDISEQLTLNESHAIDLVISMKSTNPGGDGNGGSNGNDGNGSDGNSGSDSSTSGGGSLGFLAWFGLIMTAYSRRRTKQL